jgi:hypothetical protein
MNMLAVSVHGCLEYLLSVCSRCLSYAGLSAPPDCAYRRGEPLQVINRACLRGMGGWGYHGLQEDINDA